ncbi:hypothetical protein QZH41_003105 [Actinostola sp. cb2023]|nr:hypothetical protein QZH41_003105 [Actinostola sp. cb2023]
MQTIIVNVPGWCGPPACNEDGSFAEVQCCGSTGECYCVDRKGKEIVGTRQKGRPTCERDLSACEQDRLQSNAARVGRFVPECLEDDERKPEPHNYERAEPREISVLAGDLAESTSWTVEDPRAASNTSQYSAYANPPATTSQAMASKSSESSSPEESSSATSKRVYEKWTNDEQKILVNLWAENFERIESKDSRKVWDSIAEQINKKFKGIEVTSNH